MRPHANRLGLVAVAVALVTASAAPPAPAAASSKRKVGVGRADVTPTTGGYKGGWAAPARGRSASTRGSTRAIGRWLRINGGAIYRTRPWKQAAAGDVLFTVRKRTRQRPPPST